MRVRRGTVTAGFLGVLGTGLLVGAVVAGPLFGVPAASAAVAAPATTPPASPTSVPTSVPTGTSTVPPGTPGATGTATSTSCYSYTPPTEGPGGLVLSSDFEDGTLQGWTASSGVTLTNTTEVAASGTHSLKVGGLTTTTDVGVTVSRVRTNGWHKITAKVRSSLTSAYVVLTPTSGWESVAGTARALPDGWSQLTAWIRPGTVIADWYCNGQMTGAQYPASFRTQLSLSVITCGEPYIDRPATVYVDDLTVVDTIGASTPQQTPGATGGTVGPGSTPNCGPTSPPPTTTTPPPPPPAQCVARFTVETQWPGGWLGSVAITNGTPVPLPRWTLKWTFPGAQQISSLWNSGGWTQSGQVVTATSSPWSPPLPANSAGTATLGFVVTGSTPVIPKGVTLNGTTCGVPGA